MKVSVYIATSLDGFIARQDGAIDWLPGMEPGEDYGYGAFMKTVDTLVMGRNTYEKALSFGGWPYAGHRVVVLTHRPLPPAPKGADVEAMAGTPQEVAAALAAQGARQVYLDGGRTIQAFLAAGLVDRLIITRVPVLIGSGLPLFGILPADIPLHHVRTESFASGLVQSEYGVVAGTRAPAARS